MNQTAFNSYGFSYIVAFECLVSKKTILLDYFFTVHTPRAHFILFMTFTANSTKLNGNHCFTIIIHINEAVINYSDCFVLEKTIGFIPILRKEYILDI